MNEKRNQLGSNEVQDFKESEHVDVDMESLCSSSFGSLDKFELSPKRNDNLEPTYQHPDYYSITGGANMVGCMLMVV